MQARTSTARRAGCSLTWLHLSDLHCCPPRTGWDADRVLRALREDLEKLFQEEGLKPDLLLFTGDAAYGEVAKSPLVDQFEDARRFFEDLRELCGLERDRVFLVPGNHDVHHGKISRSIRSLLSETSAETILEMLRDADADWKLALRRLEDYREFLATAGYDHLLADPGRLVYGHRLTIHGIDVGIAGLDSAWSCGGDDKGRLWLGGEWQLATAETALEGADVKIGLIHHPLRWFRAEESEEDLELRFARVFDFHLHGHEHKPWVHPLAGGTVRIAAGACYDRRRKQRPAGYNLVRLDFEARCGSAWLRQYQEDTGKWIPHHIAGWTDERGIWRLRELRCLPSPPKDAGDGKGEKTEEVDSDATGRDPAVLDAWLHHVERANANLSAAFDRPGAPRLLDHIFVELRLADRELLRSGDRRGSLPEEVIAGHPGKLGGRRTLEEVLALDRSDFPAAAITGRWLLYGDPGSGKTTLLRHLAWKLAREGTGGRWLPAFASLPRLVRAGGWFLDTLCAEHGATSHAPGALRAALDGLGEDGRLLLLFDGLDEVPAELHGRVDALLGECSDRWPDAPMVVTSRPIGGHRPGPEFRELELLPFGDADRLLFLEGWLDDPDLARQALARVRAEPSLWELSGNPLYLTLLAMLLEEKVEIPERRSALYGRILSHLIGGKHRKHRRAIPRPALVRRVLRQLADAMTEAGRDAEPMEELEERLWELEGLVAKLSKVARWRERPDVFLSEMAEKTSILGAHDGPGSDWRYWHRTFREALAAEALEEQYQRDGEASLVERARGIEGDLGRWAEPWALLVGQVAEPDALVETLMEVNRPLGLRALSTAQGLSEETFDRILGLTEDWEERAAVFRQIPDLLGDAASSLRLIERLRGRTSEIHDLFFLEESAKQVAVRWPESARAVEEVRGLFFADRAAPPAELFSRVETLDGPEPLWREIAGGTFLMGSPESEGDYDEKKNPLGGYNFERPQHEVRITGPLRMMVVPVTQAMYRAFDPSHELKRWEGVDEDELGEHPMVNVDWYEAAAFCRWLRRHGFPDARLPTEAEWEFSCRAGTTTRFWSGDGEEDLERVAWYKANAPSRTHRVGEKPSNPWGLYDMHGNVWEWCSDGWDAEAYAGRAEKQPATDPAVDEEVWNTDAVRVLRGGARGYPPQILRAAYRSWFGHRFRAPSIGFRLVCGSGPEHLDS